MAHGGSLVSELVCGTMGSGVVGMVAHVSEDSGEAGETQQIVQLGCGIARRVRRVRRVRSVEAKQASAPNSKVRVVFEEIYATRATHTFNFILSEYM